VSKSPKTEVRRRKSDGGRRMAEDGSRMSKDGGRKAEVREVVELRAITILPITPRHFWIICKSCGVKNYTAEERRVIL